MPDRFCPSCGAPGARFCASCGQPLGSSAGSAPAPSSPNSDPSPKPGPRHATRGAILALFVFAVAMGAMGLYSTALMGDAGKILYAEGVEALRATATMGRAFATMRSVLRDMCIDTG